MRAITRFIAPAVLATALAPLAASAEDIDIFQLNVPAASQRSNVLLVIDTAASNNGNLAGGTKKIDMENSVIQKLINSGAFDDVNLGLMLFTGGANKGGYVAAAVRPMNDAANKSALLAKIPVATGNNAPYANSLYEAYLYFGGKTPYVGTTGPYDAAAVAGGKYVSPASHLCQQNFIIFIGNGGPDSGENTSAGANLTGIGGKLPTDPIALTPNNYQSSWMDEFARTLKAQDVVPDVAGTQGVITYTIAVYNPDRDTTTPDVAARALLKSAAQHGGGKYYTAQTATGLETELRKILNEIQAVNSVYSSSSLPVSVNQRGTNLNQIYMGLFRPDAASSPRWAGNLKAYELKRNTSTDSLYLADARGEMAENSATGFLSPNAQSFWTSPSTFWSFNPTGVGGASDAPDGDITEKGGAAQIMRTLFDGALTTRRLYTCTGGCAGGGNLSGFPFSTANADITLSALFPDDLYPANGITDYLEKDAGDRESLINWVRGQDLDNENLNASTADIRASFHGDVLHSRPGLVNYNRYGNDHDVVAFYGSNGDGVLRAVQVGFGGSGGQEIWGFIPSEFFGRLNRLRAGFPAISADTPKPYFADGSVSTLSVDANQDGRLTSGDGSGDAVYLFISMRRGGRLLYALDVTDPANPKFLWKISPTTPGFAEMGQTWSTPLIRKVRIGGGDKHVLIMGGGYDPAVDDADPVTAANSMGRGIFVIDALTGALVWQAGPAAAGAGSNLVVPTMRYSIPADVAVLDRNRDGYADRIYAADTGANVWRVDINDSSTANWQVTWLASLGGSSAQARKFLHGPDVVYANDSTGVYDAVLVGSGDREHPFNTTVTNRFYMLKDAVTGLTASGLNNTPQITEAGLYDVTNLMHGSLNSATLLTVSGWYITLAAGEKVVSGSTTLNGTTFFNTNQPSATASEGICANLGVARSYAVSFNTGAATLDQDGTAGLSLNDRSIILAGGNFPPSPTPAIVTVDGRQYQVVLVGTNVRTPPGPPMGRRYRTFWYPVVDR